MTDAEIERLLADAVEGPWFAGDTDELQGNECFSYIHAKSGTIIAECDNASDGVIASALGAYGCKCKTDANASLIASAPDLARLALDQARELAAANARIDRMNVAIEILEDALQEAGDDYPGSSMQNWCQQKVKNARAALKEQPE